MRFRFALLALSTTACVAPAPFLDNAPCPCDESAGFVCCPSTNTCRAADVCPAEPATTVIIEDITPNSAGVGERPEVTITGAGFEEGSLVFVGREPCASIVVEPPRTIRCVVPAGRPRVSRVDVRLVVPSGSEATAAGAFRYELPAFSDMTSSAGLHRSVGGSPALVDWDDDGRLDLFFTAGTHENPTVFLNRGVFSFEPLALDRWEQSGFAVAADFTNDGRDDVMVSGNVDAFAGLYLAGSTSALTRRFHPPHFGPPHGMSPIDLDEDGDLDLFTTRIEPRSSGQWPMPFFYAENLGDTRFREDASRVPDVAEGEPTYPKAEASAVGDFDLDGDPDVLACGWYFALLINDRGRLVEGTTARGIEAVTHIDYKLGCDDVSWVDFDGDGDLDIAYVWNSDYQDISRPGVASGIVIYENRLDEGTAEFVRVADLADDFSQFECADAVSPVEHASLQLGGNVVHWFDLENDGDLDVFLPFPSPQCAGSPAVYVNHHAEGHAAFTFEPVPVEGLFASSGGAAAGDLDGDGDLDLVLQGWGNGGGDRAVLRNNRIENADEGAARLLRVRARTNGRDAVGTTIELDLDGGPGGVPDFALGSGRAMVRTLGPTGRGSGEPVAHFGLGAHDGPVWVRVHFARDRAATVMVEPGVETITIEDE